MLTVTAHLRGRLRFEETGRRVPPGILRSTIARR
jgi:hypothetical protein